MNLPLVDGAFLIDNSGLELLRCPRLFEYSFLRRRALVASKAGRNFGSTIHAGLAAHFDPANGEPTTAMEKYLADNPQPAEDFRDFRHACRVKDAYREIYKVEPFKIVTNPKDGKPLVEKPFALPFGAMVICNEEACSGWEHISVLEHLEAYDTVVPIYYCGKLDRGVEDQHGLWSHDTKTTFQFGETFWMQMQRDAGQKGYVWALGEVLGRQPLGYIIDAIRVRKPAKKDIFEDKAPVDSSDFERRPFFVSKEDLNVWKRNAIEKIKLIFYFAQTDFWPEYEGQCTTKYGACDFYDVCSCKPSAREQALTSNLYEENSWTPLNKPT